ncbi:hypothetical protein AGMMS49925_05610 [Deltaproteobacteria bacterium]|nr:hypothetical protein AGMMS49925_05610 [Deltaproteobacteria bacterium]
MLKLYLIIQRRCGVLPGMFDNVLIGGTVFEILLHWDVPPGLTERMVDGADVCCLRPNGGCRNKELTAASKPQ